MAETQTQTKTPDNPIALSLSTEEFDRPLVSIDGTMYEMRSPEELSFGIMQEVFAAQGKIKRTTAALDEAEDPDEVKGLVAQMAEAVDGTVQMCMVELPDDVRAKLTLGQQQAIVRTFFKLATDDKAASRNSSKS